VPGHASPVGLSCHPLETPLNDWRSNMPLSAMESLPSGARLWVFGCNRDLSPRDRARLTDQLAPFIERWTAHDVDLTAGFSVSEDRFVLVAVDESAVSASGCSVDALLRQLAEIERALGIGLLDGRPIWYRDESGRIISCDRDEFRRLAGDGAIDARTKVFDLTIERLGDWRSGHLEREAAESWHGRLLTSTRLGARAGPA